MYKLEDIIEDLKTEKPEVSVWEVIECLEQMQAKVEELESDHQIWNSAIYKAAAECLVSVKREIGVGGRDCMEVREAILNLVKQEGAK